jgi:hypothetical protein
LEEGPQAAAVARRQATETWMLSHGLMKDGRPFFDVQEGHVEVRKIHYAAFVSH